MNALKNMREENETAVSMHGLCPDSKIPQKLILEGQKVLNEGSSTDKHSLFAKAKIMDSINESLPRIGSLDDL